MKRLAYSVALSSLLCSALPLGGCATLPDVTVKYYPTKATIKLVTIETVACDSDYKNLVYAASTTATITGAADRKATVIPISIKAPASSGSDLDSSFTFTDDGRLKGVNITTTGEGEEIIKSAASVAAAVLTAVAIGGVAKPATPKVSKAQCDFLKALGDKGPPSLTFTGTADFGPSAAPVTSITMQGDDNAQLAKASVPAIPVPSVTVSSPTDIEPAAEGTGSEGDVQLQLQRLASVTLTVNIPTLPIWTQDVIVPTATPYELPIPRGKLFGKQSFSLALNDVGAITSVGYGRTSGSSGALNAVGSVLAINSPSAIANRAQDQADEIAQQQRLVACKADKLTCSSK
jgi:hypothetical protein